jgi:L-ascorbate metabolism protein UlaG (beta-lactamase superfamily)
LAEIQYLGHACFRLRGRDGIVLCDPYQSTVGFDIGRPTAHIVTVSHNHPGHNNIAAVRPLRDGVFVIDGPGEYEVRGVLITGVRTYHDTSKGAERGFNTVYVMHIDDVSFCHLGDLGHDLTQSQLEDIGSVDVLFIPVGGGKTIGPDVASVVSLVEPRVVIPMHYATPQHRPDCGLAPLDRFAHEFGLKDLSFHDKLSISPSTLPAEDAETQVLTMNAARD